MERDYRQSVRRPLSARSAKTGASEQPFDSPSRRVVPESWDSDDVSSQQSYPDQDTPDDEPAEKSFTSEDGPPSEKLNTSADEAAGTMSRDVSTSQGDITLASEGYHDELDASTADSQQKEPVQPVSFDKGNRRSDEVEDKAESTDALDITNPYVLANAGEEELEAAIIRKVGGLDWNTGIHIYGVISTTYPYMKDFISFYDRTNAKLASSCKTVMRLIDEVKNNRDEWLTNRRNLYFYVVPIGDQRQQEGPIFREAMLKIGEKLKPLDAALEKISRVLPAFFGEISLRLDSVHDHLKNSALDVKEYKVTFTLNEKSYTISPNTETIIPILWSTGRPADFVLHRSDVWSYPVGSISKLDDKKSLLYQLKSFGPDHFISGRVRIHWKGPRDEFLAFEKRAQ